MNIQTVIDNLDRTIIGKYEFLRQLVESKNPFAEVIKLNIDELNRIRDDLIEVRDGSIS